MARFRESSGSMLTEVGNNLVTALQDMLHTLMVAGRRLKTKGVPSVRSRMSSLRDRSEPAPIPVGKVAALVAAALVVAVLVASMFYMFTGSKPAPVATGGAVTVPAKRPAYSQSLRLAEPPPAPYAKLK
jgi:hypothetical protein